MHNTIHMRKIFLPAMFLIAILLTGAMLHAGKFSSGNCKTKVQVQKKATVRNDRIEFILPGALVI